MDSRCFDKFTKTFVESSSRRGALKVIAGGALAGLTGAIVGSREASAAKQHLCCLYICPNPGGPSRFRHRCIQAGGGCPPTEQGCPFFRADPVTKCSACGDLTG
jgi:hypothetical protein